MVQFNCVYRRCGVFPFDANLVDYTKLVSYSSHITAVSAQGNEKQKEKIKHLETTLSLVQKKISSADLTFMLNKRNKDLSFPLEDSRYALFKVWSGLKSELEDALVSQNGIY